MEHLVATAEALTAAAGSDDAAERLALLTLARGSLDAAILATVVEGRAAERSWADIGRGLGVTRQAAQARFAAACQATPANEEDVPAKSARPARPRSELLQVATAGGRPLFRLRVDRVLLPGQQRRPAR
jgi:hypothetical protein